MINAREQLDLGLTTAFAPRFSPERLASRKKGLWLSPLLVCCLEEAGGRRQSLQGFSLLTD